MGGLAGPAPAVGQVDVEGTTLSLEDAVQLALRASSQMAQARASLDNVREDQRLALGAFLPTVSASTDASTASSERFDAATQRLVSGSSQSLNGSLNMSYSVFEGGRRFSERDRVKADLTAAEADLENQRFQVIVQTKRLFYVALQQAELLEVSRASVVRAQESLDMVRLRLLAGTGTVSDTLRARLEGARAQLAVLQGETATRSGRMALGRQIGIARGMKPAPVDITPSPLPLSESEILRMAEEGAPSVRSAGAATGASRASLASARSAYFPSLSFRSGYSWSNNDIGFDGGRTSWNLRLSASYPIFNGFSREASIARAEHSTRVFRIIEQNARLEAREQADGAYRDILTAEKAITIAQGAVGVAREDFRVVNERYRLGVATILDVTTSQVSLDQAEADLVNTRYDYAIARAALEAILGREL